MNKKLSNYCSVCGAQVKYQKITYTQELEGKVYVVSDVPALVCSQCGEQYLAPATVDAIQDVVEQGKKGKTFPIRHVPVYHFPQV